MNDELRVDPSAELRVAMVEMGRCRVTCIERPKRTQDAIRNKLHIPSGRNAFQTTCRSRLSEPSFDAARNLWPEIVFVLTQNAPVENNSPRLLVSRRKTQTLKRNCHPYHVSLAGHLSLGVPNRVK